MKTVRFLKLMRDGQEEVGRLSLDGGKLVAEGEVAKRIAASATGDLSAWLSGLPRLYNGSHFRAALVAEEKGTGEFDTLGAGWITKEFDESAHPRVPAGDAAGGQFTSGGGGGTPSGQGSLGLREPGAAEQLSFGMRPSVHGPMPQIARADPLSSGSAGHVPTPMSALPQGPAPSPARAGTPSPPSPEFHSRARRSPGDGPEEGEMHRASVRSAGPLGGGITETFQVEFSDGQKGVWKPGWGERPDAVRASVTPGKQSERELAAWTVAKMVGMDDLVTPVVIKEIDDLDLRKKWHAEQVAEHGRDRADRNLAKRGVNLTTPTSRGAMLAFQQGKIAQELHGQLGHPQDVLRVAIFDDVIGNTDRHEKNWMIGPDGKARLIDHGLAFPEIAGQSRRSRFIEKVGKIDTWDAKRIKEGRAILRQYKTKQLRYLELGLPRSVNRAMVKRIREMKNQMTARLAILRPPRARLRPGTGNPLAAPAAPNPWGRRPGGGFP